jgi:1,4-dihydroxy-2-naphthoyl-CoA hydrolase
MRGGVLHPSRMNAPPSDWAAQLNENPGGFNRALGLKFVRATLDEVVAELEIGPQHLQPYGIVHGGVLSGVIETLCSVGAAMNALKNGRSVVGIENHSSFLHAVRSGQLHVTATPLTRGRRSQLWEGMVRDEAGRAIASGRVRLLCLEQEVELAGEKVALRSG